MLLRIPTQPPVIVPLPSAVAVAAGGFHTCALLVTGAPFCWGDNSQGQLGVNDATGTDRLFATGVPSFAFNVEEVVTLGGHNRVATVTALALCEPGAEVPVAHAAEAREGQSDRVGADAEERGVPQRDEPAIADHEIERHRTEDEDDDTRAKVEIAGRQEGKDGQRRDDQAIQQACRGHAWILGANPCGRRNSTAITSTLDEMCDSRLMSFMIREIRSAECTPEKKASGIPWMWT